MELYFNTTMLMVNIINVDLTNAGIYLCKQILDNELAIDYSSDFYKRQQLFIDWKEIHTAKIKG
jgi:hypothetical protein